MSLIIFSLLIAASAMSRTMSLAVSGVIYAGLSMIHFIVFGELSGENYGYYYAGAAAFDFISVACVCMSAVALGKNWHLFPLAVVIILSIVNNLFGLFIWFLEINSEIYAGAGLGIYLLVALILAGSRFNVGGILGADRAGLVHIVPTRYRFLLGY